jgi:hypothetical protein
MIFGFGLNKTLEIKGSFLPGQAETWEQNVGNFTRSSPLTEPEIKVGAQSAPAREMIRPGSSLSLFSNYCL